MKEYTKAMQAVQEAQDADEEGKHKREIDEQTQKVTMALYTQRAGESEEETLQRAMRDPEIAVRICCCLTGPLFTLVRVPNRE
ncbi:hypothetical protein JB92DRAFT_2982479 [Gautieria morchelliformis]|nr:hypothetical protein JB92DRAFT_2982479 [Gautieria morchelliformis]